MGAFVDYQTNKFYGLSNVPITIIDAESHSLWVTSLLICNRGAQPIRFNLQRYRRTGTSLEQECILASTVNLAAIYNNGIMGIGASLTNSGTLLSFNLDGITPELGARILIKNQTSTFQNGIYILTVVGDSISVPWVLTRATDFEEPTDIQNGDVINVSTGTINSNTQWKQTATVVTVGEDPIIFSVEPSVSSFILNELLIDPYTTVNIIDLSGVLNLAFTRTPYLNDQLRSYTNGYTQVYDCEVNYTLLNELPFS